MYGYANMLGKGAASPIVSQWIIDGQLMLKNILLRETRLGPHGRRTRIDSRS